MTKGQKPLAPKLPEGASFKLIGLGGIGQSVARYGSLFLASLGEARMVLIDGDTFEPSNANRMYFGACGNKATVTRDQLIERFSDSSLALIAIEEYVTKENIARLIQEGDTVILCVDNHATRKLVSDHCTTLENVTLISGGNDGVGEYGGRNHGGTFGNVQVHIRKGGQDVTPPITKWHPEIEHPGDKHPSDLSCTELIASVPQMLFTNLAVASSICNAMLLYLSGALHYSELALDIHDGLMRPVTKVNNENQNS